MTMKFKVLPSHDPRGFLYRQLPHTKQWHIPMEEEANFIYQDRGQRRDHTEPPPYRVALHQRHDTLNPGIDGGAPRLGELRVRQHAAGREVLREQAV